MTKKNNNKTNKRKKNRKKNKHNNTTKTTRKGKNKHPSKSCAGIRLRQGNRIISTHGNAGQVKVRQEGLHHREGRGASHFAGRLSWSLVAVMLRGGTHMPTHTYPHLSLYPPVHLQPPIPGKSSGIHFLTCLPYMHTHLPSHL